MPSKKLQSYLREPGAYTRSIRRLGADISPPVIWRINLNVFMRRVLSPFRENWLPLRRMPNSLALRLEWELVLYLLFLGPSYLSINRTRIDFSKVDFFMYNNLWPEKISAEKNITEENAHNKSAPLTRHFLTAHISMRANFLCALSFWCTMCVCVCAVYSVCTRGGGWQHHIPK